MEQRKDKEKILSAGTLIFVACWAAYCASYLGRINYTAALTAIVADGVFSKSHAVFIGTVYFFCYGAGQIFSGILGDRVSPYKMIGAGLAGTVCANIIMPLCSSSYITMSIIWGLNGIVQSMLWTPVLYIIATVLPEEQRSRACLHIASSFPIGSLLSYVISAAAIKFASWHFAFYIPAGIITCVLVFWCICAKKTSIILGKGEKPSLPVHENTGEKISLGKLFMISGASVICVGVLVQGMLKDGVSSWVPTLITEKYDVSASFSLLLSAIMPIINLSGAWIGTKLYEKVFRLNEAATSAFGFAMTLIPLAGRVVVGKYPIAFCVLLLALFTTIIAAMNHQLMTLIPVHFAKFGRASTVGGIFNCCTYIGSAISTYGFGAVSEKFGWTATVIFWLILGALGVAVCAIPMRRYGRFANGSGNKK